MAVGLRDNGRLTTGGAACQGAKARCPWGKKTPDSRHRREFPRQGGRHGPEGNPTTELRVVNKIGGGAWAGGPTRNFCFFYFFLRGHFRFGGKLCRIRVHGVDGTRAGARGVLKRPMRPGDQTGLLVLRSGTPRLLPGCVSA